MYMHVEFKDGSNPHLMYGDKQTIIKNYRWYKKRYGSNISVLFGGNGLECRPVFGGGYAVAKYFDGAHKTTYYKKLGNALNKLNIIV